MYETVLFDLDGTIIDSAEGIINSFTYAFQKLGLPVPTRAEMSKFMGPPLLYSFETICGLSKEEAERAVEIYREYYKEKGIYEIRVYEGMEELFQKLKAHGKRIMLATSKYEIYALLILENLGFTQYFDFAAGSLKGRERGAKKDVIEYVLACTGVDKKSTVMVGDRMHDTEGACSAGIDSIGVLFGFGTKEELLAHGATHTAADTAEIFDIICGKS